MQLELKNIDQLLDRAGIAISDEAIQKRIREAKKRVKSSDGFKAYKNYAVAEPSDNGSAGDPDKGALNVVVS